MELFRLILVSTIIIIIIITFFLSNYLKDLYNMYILSKQFVGPKAYPLIGNLYSFSGNLRRSSKMMLDIVKEYSHKKIPIRMWLGFNLLIFVDQPECIKIILKSSGAYNKGFLYRFFKPFFGNGLFTAPESKWRMQRKNIESIFKNSLIKSCENIIVKNVIAMTKKFDNSNEKDIFHDVHLCTLNVIYNGLFNVDINSQDDPHNDLAESISCVSELAMKRSYKLWLYSDFIFNNTSDGKKFNKLLASIDNITRKVIEINKKSISEDQLHGTSTCESEEQKRNIILNSIFSKEVKYSEQDLRDEVNTIVFAGSDTVAISIAFTFLMLANHPEIQSKVYAELYKIYGSTDPEDDPVVFEQIQNIGILERVIKESLRLFPPAPIIGREIKEDIKVNENLIIPKNSSVTMGIFTLHRSKQYWKNPLEFDPDRFLPGNYNPDCFLPFSSGIRNCPGRTFAMMELKLSIAIVLRKFIIQTDNPQKVKDIPLKMAVTLRPTEPIKLRFKKR